VHKSSAAAAKYDFHAMTPRSVGEPRGATSVENSKAHATDADPAGVANLINAMFEGAALLAGNLECEVEFVLNAELTDTARVVVATTHGTYQVRRR
jgi:hypothetical protein